MFFYRYNLMIDYDNGIDIELSYPIIYNSICYILSASVSSGNLFSLMPIDKNSINIQTMKDRSFFLRQSESSFLSSQFHWLMFNSLENLDTAYNDLIGIICQNTTFQTTLTYFNTTSSDFEYTFAINFNKAFYIWIFNNYNTTLVYIWGGAKYGPPN